MHNFNCRKKQDLYHFFGKIIGINIHVLVNCALFSARVLKYKICHERPQFLNPSLTSTFFPVEVAFVDRVASLSKFEYKCANRSRWNNVVNYSLKTRLCERSIRQFHAHNTRWILQLVAIAVIDRTVSNDRAASCGYTCTLYRWSCVYASAHMSTNYVHVLSRHD